MRISDWSSDVCSSDLFLPHTAYKSYPLSFLERNRFDALTRWLDGLTAIDLSGVDVSGIDSIDDWLRRLEETTELKVNHTFGTTGKLSFVPRTKEQWRKGIRSEEHTSELQSLMRISYSVFCLKKQT